MWRLRLRSPQGSPSRCTSRKRIRAGSVRSRRCARLVEETALERRDISCGHIRICANSLRVLENEKLLLRITEQVNLEPDLAAAACAPDEDRRSQPGDIVQQCRRLRCRPGGDECSRLLAQPRAGARHGQRRLRCATSFSSSSAATISIRANWSAWTAPHGRMWSSQGPEPVRSDADVPPQPRRRRAIFIDKAVRHQPRSWTIGTMTTWRMSAFTACR